MALADSQFGSDVGTWRVESALLSYALSGGNFADLPALLSTLQTSNAPVPTGWLGDRLSVMWTTFMGSRGTVDEDALTVWLAEYIRLLGEIPHDIAGQAIDAAIVKAKHGFLPSIGEIRQHADGPAADRERMIERLGMMLSALEDPRAVADINRRLDDIRANEAFHAKMEARASQASGE